MVKNKNNLLTISMLCEIANVSRSGYYNWVASEENRNLKEEQDRKDFEIILIAYNYKGYNKGARGIYMRLCKYMANLYKYDWFITPYI